MSSQYARSSDTIQYSQRSEFEARNYIQPPPYIAVPHHDQSGNQVQYQQHSVEPYVNSGTAPSYSYTNPTLQPRQQTSWVN